MRTYRVVWLLVCSAVGVTGWLVAFTLSLEAVAAGALGSAIAGSIIALVVSSTIRSRPETSRVAVLLRGALLGGAVAGAALGLVAVLGAYVLAVALVLMAGSPHVVGRVRHWLDSARPRSAAEIDAVATALSWASPGYTPFPPPSDLRLLTDEELCERWRASSRVLEHASSPDRRSDVVEERQHLLDEIERRNPATLAAWLSSEIPTTLRPQLTASCTGPQAIDWDALLERED